MGCCSGRVDYVVWFGSSAIGLVALAQILAALATGLLAVLTFLYVKATQEMVRANRDMVREMRQTNKRLNDPNVQVVLEPGKRHGSLFELAIRNTGNVSVYDVRVEIAPTDFPGLTVESLGDLHLFKVPIPILTETQEIRTILFSYMDFTSFVESNDRDSIVTFTVAYRTLQGEEGSQTYAYDLDLYKGLTDFSEASLNDVVKQLKDLKKQTKAISSATKNVSDRLEWDMRLLPKRQGEDLQASLNHFLAAWEDFESLGNRALMGFNLHKMRVLCEKTYDAACSHSDSNAALEELRRKLLSMSRLDFRLGPDPDERFTSLGNEVVEIIRELRGGDAAPRRITD